MKKPTVRLIDLKQTRQTEERGGRDGYPRRSDAFLDAKLEINGYIHDAKIHLYRHHGKVSEWGNGYEASFELVQGKEYKDQFHTCDICAGTKVHGCGPQKVPGSTAVEVGKVVFPALAALGFKLDTKFYKDNWTIFTVRVKVTKPFELKSSRYCSPEVVALTYKSEGVCPIHGRVQVIDHDVAD